MPGGTPTPAPLLPSRQTEAVHGTVQLDPQRVGRDAGTIAQEVISHLAASSVRRESDD